MTLHDRSNRQSITDNLSALAHHHETECCEWQVPDEWQLDSLLTSWVRQEAFCTRVVDTGHVLTARQDVAERFGNRPHWHEAQLR